MSKDFIRALDEIEKDKGIKKDSIIEVLEKALIKSYEDNYGQSNVEIDIDSKSGEINVYAIKDVVESEKDVIDSNLQVTLEEALVYSKRSKIGGQVKIKVTTKNFARVAAQKARNIVIQHIRDAERHAIYKNYEDKEKELINGIAQRTDFNNIYVDLGKSEGILPEKEQVPGEIINPGDRIKLFVKEVKESSKGAQIILSRKDPDFVTRLFELEVPEIAQGIVDVMSISREGGFRTKIAVYAEDENIDPVGACVGIKGSRVNSIVEEINGEKIDIIVWSKDIKTFISNSLSPSEVVDVYIDNENEEAIAFVPDNQLSLAIGKEGQNVRLAAKLTKWKIDIKPESMKDEVLAELEKQKSIREHSDSENIQNTIENENEDIVEKTKEINE